VPSKFFALVQNKAPVMPGLCFSSIANASAFAGLRHGQASGIGHADEFGIPMRVGNEKIQHITGK
jgi:hypothetical protein